MSVKPMTPSKPLRRLRCERIELREFTPLARLEKTIMAAS
jgi:hypothetical protein